MGSSNRRCLLAALVGIATLAWVAAPGPARAAGRNCDDASTTADMVECGSADYKAEDKRLNTAYRALVKKLETDQNDAAKLLVEAQRAWIKFRDANCNFEAASMASGGTLEPVLRLGCLAGTTKARTQELKAQLENVADH